MGFDLPRAPSPLGPKFFVRPSGHTVDHGWVVVDDSGRTVPTGVDENGAPIVHVFNRKWDAERRCETLRREVDAARKKGPRACICCGHSFVSEGVHNRMCGPCRQSASSETPCSFNVRENARGRKAG